jgi:hypothetical protein
VAAVDLVRRDAQAFPYDPAHELGRGNCSPEQGGVMVSSRA